MAAAGHGGGKGGAARRRWHFAATGVRLTPGSAHFAAAAEALLRDVASHNHAREKQGGHQQAHLKDEHDRDSRQDHAMIGSWELKPIGGAMTNSVYACESIRSPDATDVGVASVGSECTPPSRLLLRVYGEGTDTLIDRERERRIFHALSEQGIGPRLLAEFDNGRVEEWLHGRVLTPAEFRDQKMQASVLSQLRKFHALVIEGDSPEPVLWSVMRSWHSQALELVTNDSVSEPLIRMAGEEMEDLEAHLRSGSNEACVFCHNDLQCGNVLALNNGQLTLIDYEYAGYNPAAYDLGNLFCELAADYSIGMELDYDLYPDHSKRERIVAAYLDKDGEVDGAVNQLAAASHAYALASHLLWSIWAVIQSKLSATGLDYLQYAQTRFREYQARKVDALLAFKKGSHSLLA